MRLSDSLLVQQLDDGDAVVVDEQNDREIVVPVELLTEMATVLSHLNDRAIRAGVVE